jgi:hypothetical protein
MKMKIVSGLAATAVGAALAIGLSTHAQAITPTNYSGASTEFITSNGYIEKAVTGVGMAHRSARRTARRTSRRQAY